MQGPINECVSAHTAVSHVHSMYAMCKHGAYSGSLMPQHSAHCVHLMPCALHAACHKRFGGLSLHISVHAADCLPTLRTDGREQDGLQVLMHNKHEAQQGSSVCRVKQTC